MGKTVVEEYKLYGGKITLEYLPNSHTYKVDGDKKIGVTSITGVINKEALMLWPLGEAISYLKKKLLNADDSHQTVMWTDEELSNIITEASKQYQKKQLRGTDAGTVGHDWLEKYLRAIKDGAKLPDMMPKMTSIEPIDSDEYIRAEDNNNVIDAIESFIKWFKENKVEVLEIEKIVYSIEYDYAGRFDAILKINGKIYLVDFKTSNPSREFANGIYPENFAQLGGYDIPYAEEFPDAVIDGHAIFNFSKKSGKFYPCFSEDRELNRDFFLATLGTKRGMQHHTRKLSSLYNDKEKNETPEE